MGAVNSTSRFVLRWCETSDSAVHEQWVDLISRQPFEAVLRSGVRLREQTPVLIPGTSTSGIVRSCQQEGSVFILTISLKEEINRFSSGSQRDPGTLTVDAFLSEEQEADILKHWND